MSWISVKKTHSIGNLGVLNSLGTNRIHFSPSFSFFLIFIFIFIFHDFLCVDILDRSRLQLLIWFLAGFIFGIQYLAFGFWHLLLAYSVTHFVSVSSVTFWHLYSTHAFHQRLGSFPSLPEDVRVLPGGGVLGLIFAGYVPLASHSPYPIIVYFLANYRPHLSHFLENITIAIQT